MEPNTDSQERSRAKAEKLKAFRGEIQKGIDQAERGELVDAKDVFGHLKQDHEKDFGPQNRRT